MFVKLINAVQSYVSQYPDSLTYVGKAISWVQRQGFAPELQQLWNRISFTVNLGSFPELNVQNFTVTKASGTNALFGSTPNNANFRLTYDGFVDAARKTLSKKQSNASQLAAEAQSRAAEARRLADEARSRASEAERLTAEAQRLAAVAESEAASLSNVFQSAGRLVRA